MAALIALIVVALVGVQLGHADDRRVASGGPAPSLPRTAPAPPTSAPATIPPGPSTPGSTSPGGSGTTPGTTPGTQPGTTRTLDDVLPDLIAFVERTRGHKFKAQPVVKPLSDADFDARLRSEQKDGVAELDKRAVTWKALGLLQPDVDLRQAYDTTLGVGVLGFYVPKTKELYVQGVSITPLREAIIVHELTHALDDQWFDLNRLEKVSDPDEATAVLSLVEGSARRVERAYRSQFSADEKSSAADEEAALGQGLAPGAIPLAILVDISAPYELGRTFVDDLLKQGGTKAIDRAFGELPTTTEQISHPDKYRGKDVAIPLRLRPAPAKAVDQGTLGEFELRLLMFVTDPVGSLDPSKPPGGLDPTNFEVTSLLPTIDSWGGGRYVSWKAPDGTSCIRFVVLEQGGPGTPIRDALQKWTSTGGTLTTPDGKLVGERCA